jgi:hypothetical protein
MKAGTIFFVCVIALVLGGSTARAQVRRSGKAPSKQKPPPRALSPIDGAGINDSIYRNTYFGFQLTIPKGWIVQDDAAKKQMKEISKSIAINKDEIEKEASDAAVERTLNLLTLSKLSLGTAADFNALFACVAEPVPLYPNISSYMARLKETLRNMTIPITIETEGDVETIGGARFSVITVLMSPPHGIPARQKYYVTLKKGYALAFITTVFSESDSAVIEGIVKSVRFSRSLR